MKKRSTQSIKHQINLLKLQRQSIPERSFFGDNNHQTINAQIEILEEALVLDANDLHELWDASIDEGDKDVLQTYDWLLKNTDEPLVEEDCPWVKKSRDRIKSEPV